MANIFFDPERRAAKVSDLFAAVAPRYDLVNDLQSFGWHRLWKRRLVRLAAPRPGERALDLCCGTGDIALALARHGTRVVGLDFSEPMLQVARKKAEAEKRAGIEFVRGDAAQAPFPDNTFDIVTIGYGLRNLASWEQGLQEMRRLAKPGGRLLVLEFGKPDNRVWRGLYFSYLKLFVPLLGRMICGNAAAYAYILESLRQYPAQQNVAARMREFGLEQVRVVNLLGGIMSLHYAVKPARGVT